MGFLSALGGFVAPALNTATQAAGSYEGAQAAAAMQQRQMMLQALVFARQQREIDVQNAYREAQTKLTTRQAGVPMRGDANYNATLQSEAGAKAAGAEPFQEKELAQRLAGEGANAANVAAIRNQGVLGAAGINADSRVKAAGIGQQGADRRLPVQMQGELHSRLQGIKQTQSGQIIPSIVHGFKRMFSGPGLSLNPSSIPSTSGASGVPGAAPSQQQSDWDSAAAHADSLGQTPQQAGLPPRPVN